MMTTPRIRYTVSPATLMAALVLGACAAPASRLSTLGPAPLDRPAIATTAGEPGRVTKVPVSIHFDNQAHDDVRVYLVDARRQWLLGRVAPGARTTLRIPDDAVAGSSGPVRLSVQAGDRALSGVNEVTMSPESLGAIVSQRWSFSRSMTGGQLTSLVAR